MARRKDKKDKIIEKVEITEFAAEGKAIGKHEGKIIFVPFSAPGDVVDIKLTKDRRNHAEGLIHQMHVASKLRVNPRCIHYQTCGGCKWQHIPYPEQTKFKDQQVKDQLLRIGKIDVQEWLPILDSSNEYEYRNKLEFTFSHKRWLTYAEIQEGSIIENPQALGFHIPGKFDKILDISECHLMNKKHNELRNAIRSFAIENDIRFFNVYEFTGALRNMMVRITQKGEWMVLMIFGEPINDKLISLMKFIQDKFPFINSLLYVINQKKNDTYQDLPIEKFNGADFILENFGHLQFKISPKSFFQTNTSQAVRLYNVVRDFAGLTGNELVYDLYTGTGSIACYIADEASKVIGVEYVEDAIKDAMINADLNKIHNAQFFAGDMKDVLNDEFIQQHGKPDVIITDPPRAGMHEDVVNKLLELEAVTVVYVSCNPATQARDLNLLANKYSVIKAQPVDMFPHTHHVENVVLLKLKS